MLVAFDEDRVDYENVVTFDRRRSGNWFSTRPCDSSFFCFKKFILMNLSFLDVVTALRLCLEEEIDVSMF